MKTTFPEILLMVAMAVLLFCMLDIAHLSNAAAAVAIALVALGRLVVALEHRTRRRRTAR